MLMRSLAKVANGKDLERSKQPQDLGRLHLKHENSFFVVP
jgi:hypothetical protein